MYTRFSIWDKELKEFFDVLEQNEDWCDLLETSQSPVDPLGIKAWFYTKGPTLISKIERSNPNSYGVFEKAYRDIHGVYPKISQAEMQGYMVNLLKDFGAELFKQYRFEEVDGGIHLNTFFQNHYLLFAAKAIFNHWDFFGARARVASKLEEFVKGSPVQQAKHDGRTAFIKRELLAEKEREPNNAALGNDIINYITFIEQVNINTFTPSTTARTLISLDIPTPQPLHPHHYSGHEDRLGRAVFQKQPGDPSTPLSVTRGLKGPASQAHASTTSPPPNISPDSHGSAGDDEVHRSSSLLLAGPSSRS